MAEINETEVWNRAIQAAWETINKMVGSLPVQPKSPAVRTMRDTGLDIADAVLDLKRR